MPASLATRMRWRRSGFGWGTPEARAIYKTRGGIAEFPNAECRNRGLLQFKVRGLKKVKAQTLWHVLAFNFQRFLNLGFLEKVMSGPRTV